MKYKRTTKQKILIAILLLIIVTATILGMYAWAKYVSSTPGETSMKVAKWHFDLTNTEGTSLSEAGPIDLAETINFEHVKEDRIAPGTSGQFEMIVDTTGTEVSLVYKVEVALANCPVNLNFYSDLNHTQLISKAGDKLEFEEFVDRDDAATFTKTISIYWNWPYETLDNNNSAVAGDIQDNLDNGKIVTMNIVATGTEVLEEPTIQGGSGQDEGGDVSASNSVQSLALSHQLQRWDRVNYNPGNGTTSNLSLPEGITITGTINANSASDWVVLDIKENGDVLIVPRTFSSTNIKLEGIVEAYNNSIQALDMVAGIYLNSDYAKSVRSITVEDINKIENHSPNGTVDSKTWSNRYGMDSSNLDILDAGENNLEEMTYTSTADTGNYAYATNYFKNATFWLASRCVKLTDTNCSFCMRFSVYGNVTDNSIFHANSNGTGSTTNGGSWPVLPVVTLKSGIKLEENGTYTGVGMKDIESGTAVSETHRVWNIVEN